MSPNLTVAHVVTVGGLRVLSSLSWEVYLEGLQWQALKLIISIAFFFTFVMSYPKSLLVYRSDTLLTSITIKKKQKITMKKALVSYAPR